MAPRHHGWSAGSAIINTVHEDTRYTGKSTAYDNDFPKVSTVCDRLMLQTYFGLSKSSSGGPKKEQTFSFVDQGTDTPRVGGSIYGVRPSQNFGSLFRGYKEGQGRILTRKMDNSNAPFRAGRRSAGAACLHVLHDSKGYELSTTPNILPHKKIHLHSDDIF
uniref:Uncharacterized protein n=3 Tax=Oryza TaxID=4527 RepID=A0A0D3ERX2_9ORYZ